MSSRSGLTMLEVLIIVAIILVISAIAVPGLLSSQRASNERNASMALKALSAAEADFRTNDRDGNHINDFWTGDVKGLYTLTSAEVRGAGTAPKDEPLRLIELETAAADADPALVPAGGENMSLQPFATPSPCKGYWFAALLKDRAAGVANDVPYRRDTGGTPPMGACHNLDRFGFAAIPDSLSRGKYAFIVNQNNTIYRNVLETPARKGTAVPPGIDGLDPVHLDWPSDDTLKAMQAKDC
jgi:type II secretory pathway pseudopilin PulG